MKRRILSILLTVALLMGMLPMGVQAADVTISLGSYDTIYCAVGDEISITSYYYNLSSSARQRTGSVMYGDGSGVETVKTTGSKTTAYDSTTSTIRFTKAGTYYYAAVLYSADGSYTFEAQSPYVTIIVSDSESTAISGTTGAGTWKLEDGTLTISDGPMDAYAIGCDPSSLAYSYSNARSYPGWYTNQNSITTVVIGENVVSVGSEAFANCENLSTVIILCSNASIGAYAFYGCSSLKDVYYVGSEADWKKINISSGNDCLTNATMHYNYTDSTETVDNKCGDNLLWAYANGILTISGTGDMYDFGDAQRFDPPWAEYTDKITMISIGDGATHIGQYAFYGCTSLTKVTLGEKVTSIGAFSLAGCTELSTVIVPEKTVTIGMDAFANCQNLTEIYFTGDAPSIETDVFLGVTGTAYYPFGNNTWTKSIMQNYGGNITWMANGYTDEEVTAIKNMYVQEHLDFLDDNGLQKYNGIIYKTWASDLGKAMNTDSTAVAEILWNILNSVDETLTGSALSICDNPYDPILIALILDQTDTQLQEYSIKYENNYLDAVSTLEDLCEKADPDWKLNASEYKTYLEKLLSDPTDYKTKNPQFYEICQKVFSNLDEERLNYLLYGYQTVSTLKGALNTYNSVVEWVSDCVNYNALVTAYLETSEEFKQTLTEIDLQMALNAGNLKLSPEYIYYAYFDEALENYTEYETTDAIAGLLLQEFVSNGIEKISTIFMGTAIKNVCAYAESIGISQASWFYAFIEAYKEGWSFAEAITNNGDRVDCLELSRAYYRIEDAALKVADAYKNKFLSDSSLENAIKFDTAYSVLQNIEVYSLENYVNFLEAQQDSVNVVSEYVKSGVYDPHFNEAEIYEVAIEIMLWREAKCHANEYNSTYSAVTIACPTDVFIHDAQGKLVCSIEGNVVSNESTSIYATVVDDVKICIIPELSDYTIDVVGTDTGTMHMFVTTRNMSDSTLVQSLSYQNLDVFENEKYTVVTTDETVLYHDNAEVIGETVTEETTDHVYLIEQVVKEANCTMAGSKEYICVSCGNTKIETIPATGHTWGAGTVSKQPTATETGVKTYICSICGVRRDMQLAKLDAADTPEPEPDPEISVFTDVPEGTWYTDAVAWAVANEITKGTSETTFSPEDDCTRAQVVTFLWRYAGKPEPTTTENPFTDVEEGTDYYKAILWAYESGITKGTSDTTFGPEETCTRAQVVTFLWRYEQEPKVEQAETFTDVAEDAYYAKAVTWAVTQEITLGVGDGKFDSAGICNRAQVVTFLYRNSEK